MKGYYKLYVTRHMFHQHSIDTRNILCKATVFLQHSPSIREFYN